MQQFLFKKTLIIGLGLIGGSFAKSLRKHNISKSIYAFDIDEEILELAKSDNVIDFGSDDFFNLEEDFKDFDLIVLANPISTYEETLEDIADLVSNKTTLIDLGSVKNIKEFIQILPKSLQHNFIPCHPIAGSDKNGFENSFAEIFEGKKFIICSKNEEEEKVKKIENLAKNIKAIPEFLDAKKHDEIYALTSHLPQFLSFLTRSFSPKNIRDDFFKKAFRLDNSDPEVWEEIFAINEDNLEKFYVKFFDNLDAKLDDLYSAIDIEKNSDVNFNSKFFEENFAAIFFRALVVKSYLEIPEVKKYQPYIGTGFADFTSIISILCYDKNKLENLIENNRKKIIKFFDSIS